MTKAIDNSKVLTTLTSRAAAKATHVAAKRRRKRVVPPLSSVFPPTILGEAGSRGGLENAPSGERAEAHKPWLVWAPRKGS